MESKNKPTPQGTIKVLKPTFFKALPFQSSTLKPEQTQFIEPGFEARLHSFLIERDHVKFAMIDKSFKGKNTWFAYMGHVEIVTQNKTITWHTPNSKVLKVPYFHQLQNINRPYETCNITSVAMCLKYFGFSFTPDQLFHIANTYKLDIFDPYHLQRLIKICGANDLFYISGKIDIIKMAINAGKPCIIHGWFTEAGHIIVITGYDEKGFIVNDPYGEWYEDGYDTSVDGEALHYSYGMIERLCMPDGDLWTHVVSK